MKQDEHSLKNKTVSAIVWSFSERILAQLVSFIVSIVLARILLPEEYGIIAIVTVIISICNVFVTSGFSTALVQKKNADEVDFSTVFYFELLFSIILYIGIYFAAPIISGFYNYDVLTAVIRVMSLTLVISSVKSVQHAYITRAMQFRKFFWSTLGGTLASAVVGIVMAYCGFGVWALVAQYIMNNLIDVIILWFTVKWRPKFEFSFGHLKGLLSFGWKVLISNILYTIYEDLRTLIVGKVYTSDDLAYYQKGKQFPSLIVTNINSAISSTLLPVMAKMQDDTTAIRNTIRRFLKTGSYILMPLMVGLMVVAKPLIKLLLTEKWIDCVPYLQLMCIGHAFLPLQVANTQAVLAVGRSDISLKAEIIKRVANIIILLITFRISVMALVIGEVLATFVSLLVNTYISKKLFGYGTFAQLRDISPYMVLSFIMGIGTMSISLMNLSDIATMFLQIMIGVIIYVVLSIVFKVDSFFYVLNTIKSVLKPMIKKK